MRREVSKALKLAKIRQDTVLWEDYVAKRRQYKSTLKERKAKYDLDIKEQLKNVNGSTEAWKFIKMERRKIINREIPIPDDKMTEHFKSLLNGTTQTNNRDTPINNYEDGITIEQEEVQDAIDRLKKRKATGLDDIKSEAFIYGPEILTKQLTTQFEMCLNGSPIPEEWRSSRICLIFKKGCRKNPSNYRGIVISNAIYKLWAQIICSRLSAEVEELRILPDTQAAYRKARGTLDNIYIMNTLIHKSAAVGSYTRCLST